MEGRNSEYYIPTVHILSPQNSIFRSTCFGYVSYIWSVSAPSSVSRVCYNSETPPCRHRGTIARSKCGSHSINYDDRKYDKILQSSLEVGDYVFVGKRHIIASTLEGKLFYFGNLSLLDSLCLEIDFRAKRKRNKANANNCSPNYLRVG